MLFHIVLGWIGAFLFATCAVPQVIQTWKTRKADDLSIIFLYFWLGGEVFMLCYVVIDDVMKDITHLPLYVNYLFNMVMVLYLIYAKRFY